MKITKISLFIIFCAVSGIAAILSFKAQHRFTGVLACYTTCNPGAKFLGKNYTTTIPPLGFGLCCTIPMAGSSYIPTRVTFNGQ